MTPEEFSKRSEELEQLLFAFAMKLTRDREQAKGLMKQTINIANSRKDRFTSGTSFKAWMTTIMRNTFISNYRKKRTRDKFEQPIEDFLFAVDNKVSPNDSYVLQDLYNMMNELRDGYRIPFLMFFRGYQYNEIAEHMDLPMGTVKARIFFARKQLEEKIVAYRILKQVRDEINPTISSHDTVKVDEADKTPQMVSRPPILVHHRDLPAESIQALIDRKIDREVFFNARGINAGDLLIVHSIYPNGQRIGNALAGYVVDVTDRRDLPSHQSIILENLFTRAIVRDGETGRLGTVHPRYSLPLICGEVDEDTTFQIYLTDGSMKQVRAGDIEVLSYAPRLQDYGRPDQVLSWEDEE